MSLRDWHKNGWLGQQRRGDADYLDVCRAKRNTVEYDLAGQTTADEAAELIDFCTELKADLLQWLRRHHAGLLDPRSEP